MSRHAYGADRWRQFAITFLYDKLKIKKCKGRLCIETVVCAERQKCPALDSSGYRKTKSLRSVSPLCRYLKEFYISTAKPIINYDGAPAPVYSN